MRYIISQFVKFDILDLEQQHLLNGQLTITSNQVNNSSLKYTNFYSKSNLFIDNWYNNKIKCNFNIKRINLIDT